jgi:hypothetical protein
MRKSRFNALAYERKSIEMKMVIAPLTDKERDLLVDRVYDIDIELSKMVRKGKANADPVR